MNKLSIERRAKIIQTLVEGNSVRATCRLTSTAKGTVLSLLADVGKACADYQDKALRNLTSKRIQCDELWSFCYAKQKNVPAEHEGEFGYGDVWTWTAVDADTKLIVSYLVGKRNTEYAEMFMGDIKSRLANRVQLTTDSHGSYLVAVENTFGSEIDYAQLVKLYGNSSDPDKRYSPSECIGAKPMVMQGNPDMKQVSTSFVERQNLTMRMSMRRFTRLTNAFSKKIENLEYSVALHFMYYNFCRPHKTLTPKGSIGVTPAMAAGVTKRIWPIEDIVGLTD